MTLNVYQHPAVHVWLSSAQDGLGNRCRSTQFKVKVKKIQILDYL